MKARLSKPEPGALVALACVMISFLAAACTAPPPDQVFGPIRFDQSVPYRLNVSTIEIVTAYRPPLTQPHVDHEAPVPPLDALRGWAGARFTASGVRDRLRVTIVDARITESVLDVNKDITGTFTTERASRMEARAEVLLEVIDTTGATRASTEAEVTRSRTLAEGSTLRDRDKFLYTLTRDLAFDLDKAIAPGIAEYLAGYLR